MTKTTAVSEKPGGNTPQPEPKSDGALKGALGFLEKYYSYLTIVVLILAFTAINPAFVGVANLRNIFSDTAPLLIMSCGMTFVLLLGSIDLSVGATCSVANVLVVMLFPKIGVWAYPVTLLFGLFSGFVLGTIHTRVKIPSFIASLSFMSIWQSIALLLSPSPVSIPKKMQGIVAWSQISFGVVGLSLIMALCLVGVYYLLQSRTPYGLAVLSTGGNERASRMAGINVTWCKILTFTLCGMCSALGGMFLAAKLKSSAPTVGESFTLLVVASVALGGTSLAGGKGSVLGTVLGVFIVSIIRNGMGIIGVDAFWQNIVFGIVIIIAVSMTIDRRQTRSLAVK